MRNQPPDARSIWETTLGELQLQLPRDTYDTWLRDTVLLAHEDGSYIVGVQNVYAREWLENRLKKVILRVLEQISRRSVEISFVLYTDDKKKSSENLHEAGPLWADFAPEPEPTFEALSPEESGLNQRYTFASYAVGSCNRLAQAAAHAVVDSPGLQFNPLYIHGGVGLGKTHLLNAIGNECSRRGMHILYTSAEAFTNDLVGAIKARKMTSFRDKYRTVDVLLVDDIQFIAGKDSTQEEFYHTFNTLFNTGAQIVLASNLSPSMINGLSNRLRSRFEGGLVVELQVPDFLTAVDMLELKAQQRSIDGRISLDVIERLAEETDGSFRDLEGAFNRVVALAMVNPTIESMEIAEAAIQQSYSEPEELTVDGVIRVVAEFYGVSSEDIYGRNRSREISAARQVAMYIAYKQCNLSLPQIGDAFGGRNHSTVLYSCERVEDLISIGSKVKREIDTILHDLYPANHPHWQHHKK